MKSSGFMSECAVVGCVVLLSVLFQSNVGARQKKRETPPSQNDLPGIYVGYAKNGNEFYRIDLRADFTGYCAHVAPSYSDLHVSGVHIYKIKGFHMKDWDFGLELSALNRRDEDMLITGTAKIGPAGLLHLEVGGKNREWRDELLVINEKYLKIANDEVIAGISRIEKK